MKSRRYEKLFNGLIKLAAKEAKVNAKVKVFFHDEDEPTMQLKWDVWFKSEEDMNAFVTTFNKLAHQPENGPWVGTEMYEEEEEVYKYAVSDYYFWDIEEPESLQKELALVEQFSKILGYKVAGSAEEDKKLFEDPEAYEWGMRDSYTV